MFLNLPAHIRQTNFRKNQKVWRGYILRFKTVILYAVNKREQNFPNSFWSETCKIEEKLLVATTQLNFELWKNRKSFTLLIS